MARLMPTTLIYVMAHLVDFGVKMARWVTHRFGRSTSLPYYKWKYLFANPTKHWTIWLAAAPLVIFGPTMQGAVVGVVVFLRRTRV